MDSESNGDMRIGPRHERPAPARFVLLRHDWPEPHRDLVLQWPGEEGRERLATWALYMAGTVDDLFSPDRPQGGRAVAIAPHRAVYLDYEGPVSGNRGQVSRECRGIVVRAEHSSPAQWTFVLRLERAGGSLEGVLRIERAAPGAEPLAIRVGRTHEVQAAAGLVFWWEPAGSTWPADGGGETDTDGSGRTGTDPRL